MVAASFRDHLAPFYFATKDADGANSDDAASRASLVAACAFSLMAWPTAAHPSADRGSCSETLFWKEFA